MWGKIMITMYRLWWHGLYGLYGPRCPLSQKALKLTPHLGLTLFCRSSPGPIREIEGFVTHTYASLGEWELLFMTHICDTRPWWVTNWHKMICMRNIACTSILIKFVYIFILCIRNMWFTGICNEDLLQFSHRISLCFIVCVYQWRLQNLVAICRHMAIFLCFHLIGHQGNISGFYLLSAIHGLHRYYIIPRIETQRYIHPRVHTSVFKPGDTLLVLSGRGNVTSCLD